MRPSSAAGKFERGDQDRFYCTYASFDTFRFPPDFEMSRVSVICTWWLTALTISYTVRAATVEPVRASISTPVLWVTRQVQLIITSFPSKEISIFTWSSGNG